MESRDERKNALNQWLISHALLPSPLTLHPLPKEASARRYFRVFTPSKTFVAMDAPPLQENCLSYVAVAEILRNQGLAAPEIFAKNIELGFLLISDLGDYTYLQTLNLCNADELYSKALDTLSSLQKCEPPPGFLLPHFSKELMWQEWVWHKEWFLGKLLGLNLFKQKALDTFMEQLIEKIALQPTVFMHRDYQATNLMVLPGTVTGLLDFQDAMWGPITYDLVSLVQDCYISWPLEKVRSWILYFWQTLTNQGRLNGISAEQFLQWTDWMSIQRHLKALMTFSRKHIRDKDPRYLQHIPRTLQYLLATSKRYAEWDYFHTFLRDTINPLCSRLTLLCGQ